MRLLAIDTALENCAVAVLSTEADADTITLRSERIGRGHAERLTGMISEVLAAADVSFDQLDRIAVTVGPGSFTGVRVGLSVARGFALVLDKPVIGINTLEAIAASLTDKTNGKPLMVALKARGPEAYFQLFSAEGTPLGTPNVAPIAEIAQSELPDAVCLAGTAAQEMAELAEQSETTVLSSEIAFPDISDVARLALKADLPDVPPVPLYLKPPDAKPQQGGRIARK